jgi:hypothetical protein
MATIKMKQDHHRPPSGSNKITIGRKHVKISQWHLMKHGPNLNEARPPLEGSMVIIER